MMYLEHIHCHPQILPLTRPPPFVSLEGMALAKDRENSIIQNLGAEPIKHFFKLLIKKCYKYFTFGIIFSFWEC